MNPHAQPAAPASETPPLTGERLLMAAFAAFGLPSLAGAIALMGLAMHFLPGAA